MPTKDRPKLYTDTRCNIDQRIEDGLTQHFQKEPEAIKRALELRSYYYQVYDESNKTAGYAVPK